MYFVDKIFMAETSMPRLSNLHGELNFFVLFIYFSDGLVGLTKTI